MMNRVAILIALASMVSADITADVGSVSSLASVLSSLVSSWDSGAGLNGALAIQQTYGPLSSAVESLANDAKSASSSDINDGTISALSSLLGQITGLLDALSDKASAFSGVGASDIVKGDINGLGGPASDIVADFLSVGAASPSAIQSLSPDVDSLSSAFAKAASAYSASDPKIPLATVSGGGSESGSGAASSGAESSAAGSSGAGSSAEASSAAGSGGESSKATSAGGSSAAASGGSSGSAAGSAAASSGGASSAASSPSSNTAPEIFVGVGAVVAGAAALLL